MLPDVKCAGRKICAGRFWAARYRRSRIAMHRLSPTFVHEALLYGDLEAFLAGTMRFLAEGFERDEPALVAIPEPRLSALRDALGADAARTRFVDMGELGRNPSRILPAIAAFIDEHRGRRVWFIGEPSWPGRRDCEALEAARHEALINYAFGHTDAAILCPYDTSQLDDVRLADAERTHPCMVCGEEKWPSATYTDPLEVWAAADRPFADPAAPLADFVLEGDVGDARRAIRTHGQEAGLGAGQIAELLVSASEAVSNALLHGAAPVRVTLWLDEHDVVCDVRDRGRFVDPLAGRRRPALDSLGGRGLWIINQLCDLTEVRTDAGGTTVRMRIQRA